MHQENWFLRQAASAGGLPNARGFTLARCIYCCETLVDDVKDGRQPSLEHIIQYAIGGADRFTTTDCCNKCNSNLGDTVDSAFINEQLIGFLRVQLGLKGQSGVVPPVDTEARSLDTNEPGKVSFNADSVEIYYSPVVIRQTRGQNAEEFLVAGTPTQARDIASGMLKKAARTGKTVWTKDGVRVTNPEQLLATGEIERSSSYHSRIAVNFDNIRRGVAKIAFGFCHVVLGPTWTFSAASERLRNAAVGKTAVHELRNIVKNSSPQLRRWVAGDERHASTDHFLALLPGHSFCVLVSLFGGSAFTFLVEVGDVPARLFEDLLGRGQKISLDLCPSKRIVTWRDHMKLLTRLSRLVDCKVERSPPPEFHQVWSVTPDGAVLLTT